MTALQQAAADITRFIAQHPQARHAAIKSVAAWRKLSATSLRRAISRLERQGAQLTAGEQP